MIRTIASRIAEKIGVRGWSCNVIIGKFSMLGEHTAHKFILRVKTPNGCREFFVKVCKEPNLSKYLANEAEALEYLNELGIRGISNLILRDSYYGKEFLVESFIRGKKVSHHFDIVDRARHWLLNLYLRTQKGYVSCDNLMDKASEY